MSTFATGKYALALCDRCAQEYKFNQLRQEWNGLMTCPECYEPKHPQLDPSYHSADAQALPWTRPARQEPVVVFVGSSGDSSFESDGMQPSTEIRKLLIATKVGNVTVSTS
jgi:NAD-dependent SIR2 family protein deacetylase